MALELLKNANVAAGMVLPGCQDTGTAIVLGKRGGRVWTDGQDEEHLARGVFDTYVKRNLRYSQARVLWVEGSVPVGGAGLVLQRRGPEQPRGREG